MIYTPLTKIAMKIAFEAHKDRTDKARLPYIYHPIHLAEQMEDEYTTCAALLHDVVEDTDMTFAQLENAGFPEEVITALKLLTHEEGVPYMDYVSALKSNPIAKAVKMADLRHNSDLSRMDIVDEWALQRTEKYRKALELLEEPNEEGVML